LLAAVLAAVLVDLEMLEVVVLEDCLLIQQL
jgi:hypothetical protein